MNASPKAYHERPSEPLMVMFRILSKRSWVALQELHEVCPGSHIEHLERGLYVLFLPAGGAVEGAA